jgi:hypothetical protein
MKSGRSSEWETEAPRRILGMKLWQAAILGGMALLDCLVLAVGGLVVFSSMASNAGGSLANAAPTASPVVPPMGPTLAPTASETPLTMVFQFPTYTPFGTLAETMTLTPSPTGMMDGWVKFSVPEMEVWLPESFAAGNPLTGTDAIIASLKEKGANYDWAVIKEQLESVSDNYVMWAIDSRQGNPEVITNIAFIYDYPNPGEPLADYATRFVGAMSDSFTLIEQSNLRHPEYETVMVMLESNNSSGVRTRVALYSLRHQGLVWDILAFTAADEMPVRQPVLNRMVESFRVLQAS